MKRVISFVVVASSILALGALAFAQSPTGFVGLVAKPVPRSLARAATLPPGIGAMVVEVVPNGPAASAGIAVGDIVVSVDGHKVEEADGLASLVAARHPGDMVTVEVVRGRQRLSFRVLVGTPRPGPSRSDLPKAAGASVRS